ncbi:MAG: U32 family peptidase [Rhodospirillales bacterium]|nr:U32 family peptidase [Rhodospirillales bacterium]MDE2576835.1 U32 family peptidase [Rhodospirillales bacterium]
MKITLGPLMHHWSRERRRDFYARIADEAPVDCVHLGEVVCSKRAPFGDPDLPALSARLQEAGKEVVFSTLAFVSSQREIDDVLHRCDEGFLVEANDVSCINAIAGRPYVVGPMVNVFNEDSLTYVARLGAIRVAPPPEVSHAGLAVFARAAPLVDIEATVFGRQTLSVAARCYHARSRGLHRDNCQIVCEQDPDGLPVSTLDGQPIVAVNGTQTMSHGYVAALADLAPLARLGIRRVRLSPQDLDMIAIATLYRDTIDGRLDPAEALARLRGLTGAVPYVNGYARAREGMAWVGEPA